MTPPVRSMSATGGRTDGRDGALEELPEFELRFLLDDGERPSSVTVYSPEALETAWLTADVDVAVSLQDVR
jgi:hypothetical protein